MTPAPVPARAWHALTAVVAVAALVLQLVLILQGGRVLDEQEVPGLWTRLGRLVSYFTIQSNLLVAVSTIPLVQDPAYDGPRWRVLRLAAVIGITVTGVVHFLLLRPLLDLTGADRLADSLLHLVVPLLAILGWLVLGPHPRVTRTVQARVLAWPIAWLAWTLLVGALSGWYPYPFLDHRTDGWAAVLVTCVVITGFFVALLAGAAAVDRRRSPRVPTAV